MSAGVSSLSDAELMSMLGGSPPPPAGSDLSHLSDDDLMRQLGKPKAVNASSPTSGDASAAVGRGIINGVPVVGPYLLGGAERGIAAMRTLQSGKPYADELRHVQGFSATTAQANPYSTMSGEIGGGVLGTLPMVAAAPAAFGAGAAGLGVRTAASLASGGVIGGADAAVRSDGDIGETRRGALAGAALGSIAPAAGMAAGAGIRKFGKLLSGATARAPGMTAAATGKLAEDIRNAGGVEPVRGRLAELGPEAMLLDASPSFEGRAQGLAVLPDTREAVMRPVAERARGANARLGEDVNRHIGQPMDPDAFHGAFREAYEQEVPPLYQQALSRPVTVDTSNVLETIGRLGATEKGGAERALQRAWGLLHTENDVPGVGRAMVPDRRPEALHNAKEALDAMIAIVQAQQGSAARSELRALSTVRSGVNDALEAQVPGYVEANRTAQHLFQQRDAFDHGQTLLNGGREAARPAQLATETAAMTPQVQQAQRLGLRAEVDRLLGTQLNDRVALRKALLGEGDYNRARMGTVFGEEPTAGLAGAVEREAAFDAAHQRINNNAMTELRKRAADDVAPREVKAGGGDVGTAVAGYAGGIPGVLAALGLKGARLGSSSAGRAADIARNREIAQAVTMRQDDEALNRLLDALGARALRDRMATQAARSAEIGANAAVRSQGDRLQPYLPEAPFGFR